MKIIAVRVCIDCGFELPLSKFRKFKSEGKVYHSHYCLDCKRIRDRKYYHVNKIRRNNIRKQQRIERKKETLAHYGGVCSCCKENRYEFLCIDHINGGGNIHRKKIGDGGTSFYGWLKKNDYPVGFQVLCHNCNMSKGSYGYCPHQGKRT